MAVNHIPEGFTNVTPYLVVNGAAELIEFLKQAFDAEETMRLVAPGGELIGHAEVKIGSSVVMLADAHGEYEPRQTMLHVYFPDVDGVYERAVAAGAIPKTAPKDEFYGDRSGQVIDRWGNFYNIATHIEDVTAEEIERRAAAFAA